MKAKFSPSVQKVLIKLQKKDKQLYARIQKQILFFESNPKHHSLRLHQLTGNLQDFWSISINKSIRMVYQQREENVAYFIKIGTHEEVYEK